MRVGTKENELTVQECGSFPTMGTSVGTKYIELLSQLEQFDRKYN